MELTAIIYAWVPLSENKLIELLLYSPIFEIELTRNIYMYSNIENTTDRNFFIIPYFEQN